MEDEALLGLSGASHRRRAVRLLTIGVVAVGIAFAASRFDGLEAARLASVDARFAMRGDQGPGRHVMLVGIDDSSLEKLPRWPFSRELHARVLRRLRDAGARLIVYDVDFDRPSSPTADQALYEAADYARPVVFGTTGIRVDGTTQVLGSDDNLRAIGARAAAALLPLDVDETVRRYPAEVKHLPSIASSVAGRPSSGWIDFRGSQATFAAISFVDVLRGKFDRAKVRGNIVVVGATAPVIHDQHQTAVDGAMSGAELQANAIATALRGSPLDDAPDWAGLLAIVMLGLAGPLTGLRLGLAGIAVVGSAVAAVWLVLAQLAFGVGTIVDLVSPLFALAAGVAGTGGYRAVVDSRERASLRRAFATFHPLLIDRVLAGEAGNTLGPEDVIGGYRIQEVVGRGGMGVVYRAQQLALDRTEAVKLISEAYAADFAYRERFVRESRIAARIEHPNVVPVYSAGADRGLLYIAMRLIDGVTLQDAVRAQGSLPLPEVVAAVGQLANALDASHALGLVHRDVKPANVLLAGGDARHVYLTDFGIAHDARAADAAAEPGIVGSPEYLAPEQIDGGELGPWTDVYALAGVLVFCLTGVPPFPGQTVLQVLAAKRSQPPPHLSKGRPLPPALDVVVASALAVDASARPQTAGELAAAVRRAAAEQVPVPQRDVTRPPAAGADDVTLGPE